MSDRDYTGVRTGGPNRLYPVCMLQPPPERISGLADGAKMNVWLPCDLPAGHSGPHNVEMLTFEEH